MSYAVLVGAHGITGGCVAADQSEPRVWWYMATALMERRSLLVLLHYQALMHTRATLLVPHTWNVLRMCVRSKPFDHAASRVTGNGRRLHCVVSSISASWQQRVTDREALLTLFRDTGGPSWHNNDGWGSDRPLGEWHGVTATSTGRVTGLALRYNNLRGKFPAVARLTSCDRRRGRLFDLLFKVQKVPETEKETSPYS